MVTLVVEGAVGNDNVGRRTFGFLPPLLRPQHYQRQLPRRLPHLVFLRNLLRVCGQVLGPLVAPRLGTFGIIDLVPRIMRTLVDR